MVSATGCSSLLKQRWVNFRSYYNTYFNANQSFQKGYKVQKEQVREINPELPVRIHPPVVRAGAQDFENSIEKSYDLLRNFKDSKWTDDAVFLIGKSYFFQQEFFSALEKFNELYRISEDPRLTQEAIYWKGRTFYELKSYDQGIQYLEAELANEDRKWDRAVRAETQATLAEFYVAREEYDLALEILEPALGRLQFSDENAYAYFLYGQLLERANRAPEALQAYRKVPGFNPVYSVIYQARRKQAEIAREEGLFEEALKDFKRMARDDKNFEIVTDLEYEIARTYLEMQRFEDAESTYRYILYETIQQVKNLTKAKTYNDLGKLYKEGYNDWFQAQAYYDSSAALRPDPNLVPEDFQAFELAEDLGSYVDIRLQIQDRDSLLRLGRMSETELDSVIQRIKEQKQRELEELERQRRREQNTLVNMNANTQQQQQNTTGGSAGFLSSRNPQLMQDNAQRFKAIWGDRPLVRNWRRLEAIRNQQRQETETTQADSSAAPEVGGSQNAALMELNIDLSAIPFTPEAQQKMELENIVSYYQLGNLFYMRLNEPDSALRQFERVIQFPDTVSVRPQALYAAIEILYNSDQAARSIPYFNLLKSEAPNAIYTKQAALLLDREDEVQTEEAPELLIEAKVRNDVAKLSSSVRDSSFNRYSLSDSLLQLALEYPDAKASAIAFQEALVPLIEHARLDSAYQQRLKIRLQLEDSVQSQQERFKHLQDSLASALSDTTLVLPDSLKQSYKSVIDSTLEAFDYEPYFPYLGQKWDEVRSRLLYADSINYLVPSKDWWIGLAKELRLPKMFEKAPTITADTSAYYSCEDADWSANPIIAVEDFVRDSLQIPDELNQMSMFLEVGYEIYADTAGKVDSLVLLSEPSGIGLEQLLEERLKSSFMIEPVITSDNKKIQTKCTFFFPIALGAKSEETPIPPPSDSLKTEDQ